MIIFSVVPLIDNVDDLINEAIQPDEGVQAAGSFDQGQQPGRALLPEFLRLSRDVSSLALHG